MNLTLLLTSPLATNPAFTDAAMSQYNAMLFLLVVAFVAGMAFGKSWGQNVGRRETLRRMGVRTPRHE